MTDLSRIAHMNDARLTLAPHARDTALPLAPPVKVSASRQNQATV